MAQNSSIFNKWSSYNHEAVETNADDGSTMLPALSTDLETSLLWPSQLERTRFPVPAQIHFQSSDMLGSGGSRIYERGHVSEFHSDDNRMFFVGVPEGSPPLYANDFSEIYRSNSDPTGTQLEDVSLAPDHQHEEPPEKRRGRRRASECPDGWVASKNLISERKRREKLKDGLLELRSLVPKITKMDKVSILSDAIDHVQDLKKKVEMLEGLNNAIGDGYIDHKFIDHGNSSGNDLKICETEDEGTEDQNNSSTNGSCSERVDEVMLCDHQMSNSSSREWNSQQMQLDVTKLDHGIYKLNITCRKQSGLLVQLSQAIELFVLEIVHTNIVVITSTKVTCTFIVKMSSSNDMTLENVKADVKQLLGQSGLQF